MSPTDTTLLTVHLPSPLAEQLENFVSRLGCTRSVVVSQALAMWIRMQEQAAYEGEKVRGTRAVPGPENDQA